MPMRRLALPSLVLAAITLLASAGGLVRDLRTK